MQEFPHIILDLDGTLIDYRPKMYFVFQALTNSQLDFKEYLDYRLSGYTNYEIYKTYEVYKLNQGEFNEHFRTLVETEDALLHDFVFPGVREWMASLISRGYPLLLCTARRDISKLEWQLKHLELYDLFLEVHNTQGESKRKFFSNASHGSTVIISDSSDDFKAAKDLNAKKIFVRSGFERTSTHQVHMETEWVTDISFSTFEPPAGIEPATSALRERRSTD